MLLYMLCYHVMKEILNNSTNISKTNNYLWPQIFEHKKDQGSILMQKFAYLITYLPTI